MYTLFKGSIIRPISATSSYPCSNVCMTITAFANFLLGMRIVYLSVSRCTILEYAGRVKCHNVCKRQVAILLVLNQLNVPFFSTLFQWDNKCNDGNCFQVYFEETMQNLYLSVFLEITSYKNRYPGPVCNFGFTELQCSDKCLSNFAAEMPYLTQR